MKLFFPDALHNQQIPLTVKSAETSDDFYNPDKPDGEGGQGEGLRLFVVLDGIEVFS